jgi:hypothetical protein
MGQFKATVSLVAFHGHLWLAAVCSCHSIEIHMHGKQRGPITAGCIHVQCEARMRMHGSKICERFVR